MSQRFQSAADAAVVAIDTLQFQSAADAVAG